MSIVPPLTLNWKITRGAIDDCNKAIELQPKYAPAYYNLSECYKSLGETAKAQAAFVKAKQLGYRV